MEHEQKIKQSLKDNAITLNALYDIDQLSKLEINKIFTVAQEYKKYIKRGEQKKMSILRGKSIINFFFESSTRTRTSFELAGKHLGADTINVTASSAASKKKKETLVDTVRTLNAMQTDMIILRHAKAGTPHLIAKQVDAKVISAGDGYHQHPSQALLDLFTILEKHPNPKGLKMTIIGDIRHSRVAGSLMRLMPRYGIEVTLTGPSTMMPEKVEEVFDVGVNTDGDAAMTDADILYNIRVQRERGALQTIPTLREYAHRYCINEKRLALAENNVMVMDAGPVNREVGIRSEVLESEKSYIENQVQNGFFVRLALLSLMLQ
jgi:aspartate carbamoyltransferase catalytic subunit